MNALRLEAGIPWFPDDFNDTVIPHEAALEATHISFSKGCYTGQEIVERVRSRGQVNRRRVQVKFSIAEPPAPLTRLYARESAATARKARKPRPLKPKKSASSLAPHFLPPRTPPSAWRTSAASTILRALSSISAAARTRPPKYCRRSFTTSTWFTSSFHLYSGGDDVSRHERGTAASHRLVHREKRRGVGSARFRCWIPHGAGQIGSKRGDFSPRFGHSARRKGFCGRRGTIRSHRNSPLRRHSRGPAREIDPRFRRNENFLTDVNTVRMDWLWSNALGGVRLFVKDSDASAAEELLNQSFQDSFEVEGQERFTQPRCPVCQSFDVSYKGLHKRIAYASIILQVPIPLSRLGWRCASCGHMWEDPDDVEAQQPDER